MRAIECERNWGQVYKQCTCQSRRYISRPDPFLRIHRPGTECLRLCIARDVAADPVQGVGLAGVAIGQALQAGRVALQTPVNYNVIHQTRGEKIMAANQLVQARIDGAIKEEAAAVLAAMGLTVSDAVRLMLTKVAREHALPFDPLIPNATTIAAMKEARTGNLPRVNSIADLKAALNAGD